MSDADALIRPFEDHRAHLRAVAFRMLGSAAEADDAVQEAWIRLHRADTSDVANLGGWLTTVVSRVCLDMLRARKSRREELVGAQLPDDVAARTDDAEHEARLADAVGPALLVVLETLAPAERIAFVLHDLFGIPFEQIAAVVGRSPAATRQLASRGRRRVQGGANASLDDEADDHARQRAIVDAFAAASREGRFDALLAVLDPNVVLRADGIAVAYFGGTEIRGPDMIAKAFSGRARGARPATVDGLPGLVWAPGGVAKVAFSIAVENGKIVAIDLVADPARIAQWPIEILGPSTAGA